jgi:hypothetical protein
MDDEADGCGDEIAGPEPSPAYVALNEPTPSEHLISKLQDAPRKILQGS